jgi:replicative DNA helicase
MQVDLPALLAAAERLGHRESITTDREIQYINSLKEFPVNKDNVFNFALEIKKYEFARKIKSIAKNVCNSVDDLDGTESIDDIISLLENPVVEFLKEDSVGEKPEALSQDIFAYLEYLENNQCDIVGIPTGFSRYDAAIGGGIRRKCVDLIAARPKTGKSVFADAVAINVSGTGVPVLMLDTEMGKNDHIHRILSSLSGVDLKLIETGKFANDESRIKVHEAAHKVKKMPYDYISVAGKSFESILNIIKRWVHHTVGVDDNGVTKDCLIIYDYLKLMSGSGLTGNMQEFQALGFQITSLHNLCVKLDVPCLSFVQLNRDGITKESTDAVSGSDRLIWLCTSFTIFKQKSDEEIAEDGPNAGNRKLVPIVSRHGGGLNDGDYINMKMVGKQTRLEELKTRN